MASLCPAAALQHALRAAGGLAGAGGAAVLRSDGVLTADASDGQQRGGSAATAAEAADGGQQPLGTNLPGGLATAVAVNGGDSPPRGTAETVLDLRCGGATVLTVGVAARTGRLTLRLGPGAADESALDQGAFTKQVSLPPPRRCAMATVRMRKGFCHTWWFYWQRRRRGPLRSVGCTHVLPDLPDRGTYNFIPMEHTASNLC